MSFSRREYLGLVASALATRAPVSVLDEWREIASRTDGIVGAATLDPRSGRHFSLNGQDRFPLASVCKLPIAICILSMVDEGTLHRDQVIDILPRDVWRCWEGDIGDSWPAKHKFRLDELIQLMVAHSDNTAVQTLFRVGGEREGMNAAFRKWKIEGIRVDRYEGQCFLASHGVLEQPPVPEWRPNMPKILCSRVSGATQYAGMRRSLADPRDTGSPDSTVKLLAALYKGSLLSQTSTARMLQLLEQSQTGRHRIRCLLASSVVVGDKTGTADTVNGLNGATNDVGLIMPENSNALAIAVYIKGSTRSLAIRERIIAQIAKAAYDHWITC